MLQWYQTLWFAMFVFFMLYCRDVVLAVFRTCVAYTTQVNSTFHMRWLASSEVISQVYTCQLFLKYRPEIFILGVLGFLKTTQSFPSIPKEVPSLPKTSICDVSGNSPRISQSQSKDAFKCELAPSAFHFKNQRSWGRYCHLFILPHGFCFLHGSELTYFWKLCQARQQQLTFFNQEWEIGPQARVGMRSKFSTQRQLAGIQVLFTSKQPYIPQKWIVLFACADWLARWWSAKYYSPPSNRRKTKWLSSVYVTNRVTLWAASYSACVVCTKTVIHFSVGESGG